ncbi:MAG: hypothetical protein JSV84_17135 [Gemmatimonadota bacterium]|nr:MAG: hypothetical protein JSV84_17135 [Gemmatimonadota bacterium]
MLESCSCPGFLDESFFGFGITGESRGQKLEGLGTFVPYILGFGYHTRIALAHFPEDFGNGIWFRRS